MKKQYKQKKSYNKEKRIKNPSIRVQQYKDYNKSKEENYEKELIQRKGKKTLILGDHRGKKLIQTRNETNARRNKNRVISESIPTDNDKKEFFGLLRFNMRAINEAFKCNETIFYKITTRGNEEFALRINQVNLPHLLGMHRQVWTQEKSPFAKIFDNWFGLNTVQRFNTILKGKDKLETREKSIGKIINYVKCRDKNKSLFFFDLFNSNRANVFAKKMTKKQVDELYGDVYMESNKDESKNTPYILLEKIVKFADEKRYITVMFKDIDFKNEFIPTSIIETIDRRLKDKNEAEMEMIDEKEYDSIRKKYISMQSVVLNALANGIHKEDLDEAEKQQMYGKRGNQR